MTGGRSLAMAVPAAVGVLLLLGILLYRWKEREGCFALDRAMLWGCRPADSSSVAAAMSPFFGTPLGRLDLDAMGLVLEGVPGVERAEIWREWPDAVGVSLDMAKPAVVFVYGGVPSIISSRGESLPRSFLSDSIPVIGLRTIPPTLLLRSVVAWAAAGGTAAGVDSLLIDETGLVALVGGRRVLLGGERFTERLMEWGAVSGDRACSGDWEEADMRYDGQVVLRSAPSPGGGA